MTWANTTLKPYTYDGVKAVSCRIGWTDTDGDGYVDKDNKNLKVKVVTYTERGLRRC